jgi:hypothetical protein
MYYCLFIAAPSIIQSVYVLQPHLPCERLLQKWILHTKAKKLTQIPLIWTEVVLYDDFVNKLKMYSNLITLTVVAAAGAVVVV